MTIAERMKAKADKSEPSKSTKEGKAESTKTSPIKNRTVDRELIVINPKLQCRQSMCEDVVYEYHQLIKDGVKMPPLRCVDIEGEIHLVDGFTRYAALTRSGKTRVDIAVSIGTHDDAVREACGANRTHGMRRTTADIKKAVTLAETTFAGISRKDIANMIGVSLRSIYNHSEAPKKETRPAKENETEVATETLIDPPKESANEVAKSEPVTVPKKAPTSSTAKAKTPKVDPKTEEVEDDLEGDACVECGCTTWELSDGGRQCKKCQFPIEKNVGKKKVDKSKIDTALGKLVREIENAGLYSDMKELLDAVSAKLVTL